MLLGLIYAFQEKLVRSAKKHSGSCKQQCAALGASSRIGWCLQCLFKDGVSGIVSL